MDHCCIFSVLFFFTYASSEICDVSDDLNSCYKKFLSFEALTHIHKYLDGDQNGEVDSREAAKFVYDEFSPIERARQPRSLPLDDPFVSLSDLWFMWRRNPAFNWTIEETIKWLINNVVLPQYEDTFRRHMVDGKSLPLLAIQNMSYLTDVLLIRNPIDKNKLMVKALDLILFGPPQKPLMLSTRVPLATVICGLALILLAGLTNWIYHHSFVKNKDHNHVPDGAAATEVALKQLQHRLNNLETLRFMLNNCEDNAEIGSITSSTMPTKNMLTSSSLMPLDRVASPRKQQEDVSSKFAVGGSDTDREDGLDWDRDSVYPLEHPDESAWPLDDWDDDFLQKRLDPHTLSELHLWLQLTFQLELEQHRARKMEAEQQLNAARLACKRVHRKRYHLLGSVRLLHTDSLDELERRLLQAELVLNQLQHEIRERAIRWKRIEIITGLSIRQNKTLTQIRSALNQLSTSSPSAAGPEIVPTAFFPTTRESSDLLFGLSDSTSTLTHVTSEFPTSIKRISTSGSKVNLPRNYSFVRPFANIWRRKTRHNNPN